MSSYTRPNRMNVRGHTNYRTQKRREGISVVIGYLLVIYHHDEKKKERGGNTLLGGILFVAITLTGKNCLSSCSSSSAWVLGYPLRANHHQYSRCKNVGF
mmetsp:Transcript_7310/g.8008  ORF Transcript_7310/g.8008 Transcript_7310/m.8008 type:complete len:100 (+) Transcript_7310:40-339(+)